MRILFINQFFWPDAAATGQFLEDLVRHLAAQGHQVTVISSANQYASAPPDSPPPPARILRVRGVPFARSTAGRALSYASFYWGSMWRALRTPRPDLIVTMTTPPMLSAIGMLLQTLRGARHFIWEMDLFPDALVSLGAMRQGSCAERAMGWLTDLSRRRSDGVIALGPCMQERLLRRGIPAGRIHVADNWADSAEITPQPFHHGDELRLLYSGNLGLSHDIVTIAQAMEALAGDTRFRFCFAGGGARRQELERICHRQGLAQVSFLPYARRGDLSSSLARADIGLVTVRDECVGTVVPSKVYGLLAAGRPILFIGPPGASAARLIARHRCGWQVDCGDVAGLVRLLRQLQTGRRQVRAAGLLGRRAFLRHYDRSAGLARIAAILGVPHAVPPAREGVALALRPDDGGAGDSPAQGCPKARPTAAPRIWCDRPVLGTAPQAVAAPGVPSADPAAAPQALADPSRGALWSRQGAPPAVAAPGVPSRDPAVPQPAPGPSAAGELVST